MVNYFGDKNCCWNKKNKKYLLEKTDISVKKRTLTTYGCEHLFTEDCETHYRMYASSYPC